ncbi:uncharacterized protein LOC141852420 [Brevipalpus obovatus]|uniref:uncharacterized protein LOC141852420 n=1 Tax=Brevipalpus obovatus TaxID=246614 RepID=UPI003D9F1100
MPENTIHTLRDELDRAGDREIRLDEMEVYTTDIKKKIHRTPTASPYMPKRNTEEKGWYKQWAEDMGHTSPRAVTPVIRKANMFESMSQNDYKYRSDSRISRTFSNASDTGRSTPRDRSLSPRRSEKNVRIGSVTELETESSGTQEFYAHRDATHGKPLPGENSYMFCSWPYGLDANHGRRRREPSSPPPRSRSPNFWGSRTSLNRSRSPSPGAMRRTRSVPPADFGVKKEAKKDKIVSEPATPLPDYLSRLRHIKVSTVPVPVPPKFGTLMYGGRWADWAEAPVLGGPPCELCHKPITESRCIMHENFKYHCWHFQCSFCLKTLKENDFVMAMDQKPYCTNCNKRMYPKK